MFFIAGITGNIGGAAAKMLLGASHEHLRDDYENLLTNAFGADKGKCPAASPARFDPAEISVRVRENKAPRFVVLDEST